MHPNPFVIQEDPQLLHFVSVLYVVGAPVQFRLLGTQGCGSTVVP